MRKLLVLLLTLGALALTLAGCGSTDLLPTRVRERFEAPQPKTHVFAAAKAPVFEAVQTALRRLDFQVSRAGAAQGLVRAHSGLRAGESFGKARQYAFEIHVEEIEPGRTEVSAVLREQEESDSFAGATDIPQREHGLYDSLFAATEQVLREHGALAAEPAK